MRKTQISKKHKATIVGGTVAALVMGGAAFAYWTAGGSGTGSAATSSGTSGISVVSVSSPTNMYPGDAPQALTFKLANSAANKAYVTKVVVSIASITQAQNASGPCNAADYSLANPTFLYGQEVPGNSTTVLLGGGASDPSIQFNDTGSNQDGCKGATVNLAYTAS